MPQSEIALVTGGGRGIGASIARELTDAGFRVAVGGRTAEQVEEVAGEVDGLALVGDVSRREDVEAWVEATERELGPIDLLVNNAGISGPGGPLWETEPEAWWQVFEINVFGLYLCCRAVLPGMIERGRGRIVNLGSGAGYLPGGGIVNSVYGASKAAVNRLGEMLDEQTAEHGVHVFTISPGLVRTAMTESFGDDAPWTTPELAPRSCARSHQARRTPSRAATSTPSTTISTT